MSKAMRKEDLIERLKELPDGTIIAVRDNDYGLGEVEVSQARYVLEDAYLYTDNEGREIIKDPYPHSFMEERGIPFKPVKVFVIDK